MYNKTQMYYIFQKYLPLLLIISSIVVTIFLGILSLRFKIIPEKYIVLSIIASIILVIYTIISQKLSLSGVNEIKISEKFIDNKLPSLSHINQTLLTLLFALGMIVLLIILQLTSTRPTIYFLICGIVSTILALIILFTGTNKSRIFHLVYILAYSTLTTLAIFKYYFWSGTDTWTHAAWNELIANAGTIGVAYGKEIGYPIQHIAVTISQILPQVDVRTASILAVSIPSIILSILVYIIMRRFVGDKLGLLACLLINICGHVIYWRILGQTTSYGVMMMLLLLSLYIIYSTLPNKDFKKRYLLLYIFCFMILCITHQFSTFIFIFILTGIYLGSVISYMKLMTREFPLLVTSFLIMIVVWISVSFGLVSAASIFRDALFQTTGAVEINQYVNIIPPNTIESIFGSPEFIVFLVILPFIYLSLKYHRYHNERSQFILTLSMSYLICLGACAVSLVMGSRMSGRFTAILELFCIMALVILCYDSIKKINNKKTLSCLFIVLCLGVGILSFINLPYQGLAPDNPIWTDGSVVNDGVSTPEFIGVKTSAKYMPDMATIICESNNIKGVMYYHLFNKEYLIHSIVPAINSLPYTLTLTDWTDLSNHTNEYLIFRNSLISSPLHNSLSFEDGTVITQTYQLQPSEICMIDENNNLLYENGDISGYMLK